MRIAIFSDCHCGYAYGEERGEDSFVALEEAIDRSLDCDLILIAGDLFDSRIPKPEVFAKTAKILSKAQNVQKNTKFLDILNKEKHDISPLSLRGIPIVAIHGTHERRSKYLINPLQSLEHAGLLIHLHCATILFEIDGKKVAIHGMSGVSERYAKDVLNQWNPKPIPEAINILMIHQSVDPYIYSPLEPPSLKLEDLPKYFDLYVLGHIHWNDMKILHNGQLLLSGSTIPTSLHRIETEQQKCIFKFSGQIEKIPLQKQRKIFWKDMYFNPTIKENIQNLIVTTPLLDPKPVLIFKIKGQIPKNAVLPNFNDLEEKYRDRAIINIYKSFEIEGFEEQVELLRLLREQKLSPEEQGLKILQQNLRQNNCGIKVEEIFDMLVNGDSDLIFNLLTGRQKTLVSI